MSREEVIHRIVQRELEDRSITEEAVIEAAPDLHRLACEHFGTWGTALEYAGVNRRSLHAGECYTRAWVIREIRRFCAVGYRPSVKVARHHNHRLYEAARQHFGTWRKALVAAGLDLQYALLRTRKPRRLDRAKVLDELRAWSAAGCSLRWTDVCLENRALAVAAKGLFQSWRGALVAAGLAAEAPPRKSRTKWDRQRVIESIQRRQKEGKPMKCAQVQSDDNSLVCAARRYFGGWTNAMIAAGFRPDRPAD